MHTRFYNNSRHDILRFIFRFLDTDELVHNDNLSLSLLQPSTQSFYFSVSVSRPFLSLYLSLSKLDILISLLTFLLFLALTHVTNSFLFCAPIRSYLLFLPLSYWFFFCIHIKCFNKLIQWIPHFIRPHPAYRACWCWRTPRGYTLPPKYFNLQRKWSTKRAVMAVDGLMPNGWVG